MSADHLIYTIKDILARHRPKEIEAEGGDYRHAAVLVPLLLDQEHCCVLFTKRTEMVDQHKGQISFPGGAVDETDSSVEHTALREAEEEIGLRPSEVLVLGRLDDTLTIVSNYIIHPVVGVVPNDYEYQLNSFEVDKILKVPLAQFRSCSTEEEGRFTYLGTTYATPCYKYDGEVIWGATARIMTNFMEVVGKKLLLLQQSR